MPKSRRVPVQERSRATTEALFTAIGLVVGQHGVEGLTVRRVATRAGVALGAAYQYYPSADALIAAWELGQLARLGDRLRARVAEQIAAHAPLRPAVRVVIHAGIEDFAEIVRHYRRPETLFSSLHDRLDVVRELAARLATVLEQLPSRSQLRAADLAAAVYMAICTAGYNVVVVQTSPLDDAERVRWRGVLADMVVASLVEDA